jgi:hypothetical protein
VGNSRLLQITDAGFVLLPAAPLLATIFYSQVLNGVLLPVVLVLTLIINTLPLGNEGTLFLAGRHALPADGENARFSA